MNDLLQRLEGTNCGIFVALQWLGAVLFADDILLATYIPSDMQTLLNELHPHSINGRYAINDDDKATCIMSIPPHPNNVLSPTWHCGDLAITLTHSYKYLGIVIDDQLTFDEHIQKLRTSFIATSKKLAEWGCTHGKLKTRSALHIMKACLIPQISYGMILWYNDNTHSEAINDLL